MELNSIFRDGMVLAADKPIRVFGQGQGLVTVRFLGETVTAVSSGADWYVELSPRTVGGPYEMQIDLDGVNVEIKDIYVGVVLLLHGQSNMAFQLRQSAFSKEAYRYCDRVRLYSPKKALEGIAALEEKWVSCNETYAGQFSAIGYHVGIQLAEELGCAVGMISCHQGASVIQAWMDEDAEARLGIHLLPEERYRDWVKFAAWNQAGCLYRQLVLQLTPYSLSHILWYQGESNASVAEANVYGLLLKELIRLRRADFADPRLPFIVIQLANNQNRAGEAWSKIQASQLEIANEMQDVYSVICADVCEDDDIHPPTKAPLGERIANVILHLNC